MSMDLKNKKLTALIITVIEGQDGAYLAEFLLEKGYDCHAIVCFSEPGNPKPIDENCSYLDNIYLQKEKLRVHAQDVRDTRGLANLIMNLKPAEIYYLTSKDSMDNELPAYLGTSSDRMPEMDEIRRLNIINAIQMCGLEKSVKVFQELTTDVTQIPPSTFAPQPLSPNYPASLCGLGVTKNCRKAQNLFFCNGVLFSRESPRQSHGMLSRRITMGVARIHFGFKEILQFGNLNFTKDWGHARDYARAVWLTLQQEEPDDYAIAAGVWKTMREFVEVAFEFVGIVVQWMGEGADEIGRDKKTGKLLVRVNSTSYCREKNLPCKKEHYPLMREAIATKRKLNWQPYVTFRTLVAEMMTADLSLLKEQLEQQLN